MKPRKDRATTWGRGIAEQAAFTSSHYSTTCHELPLWFDSLLKSTYHSIKVLRKRPQELTQDLQVTSHKIAPYRAQEALKKTHSTNCLSDLLAPHSECIQNTSLSHIRARESHTLVGLEVNHMTTRKGLPLVLTGLDNLVSLIILPP